MNQDSYEYIPYNCQQISDDDIAAVIRVLKSSYITTGPEVGKFEEEFASYMNTKYAVSCSSGTAALHLACMALELSKNDCAIVPAISFLATANAPHYCGAKIIFADVNPETGLLTAACFEQAINRAKKEYGVMPNVVLPVHLAGQSCDMEVISDIAKKYNIRVIEDCAHSLGAKYSHVNNELSLVGDNVYSDMSIFSFHPVKSITTGEGGMVVTNNESLKFMLQKLRNHGIERNHNQMRFKEQAYDENGVENPWYHELHHLSLNYRLSDISAALGRTQLRSLEKFIQRRTEIADLYQSLLLPYAEWIRPLSRVTNCFSAWHLYSVLIDFDKLKISKAALMNSLKEQGVGTQVHYIPINQQPYYSKKFSHELPGADAFYKRTLSLPIHVNLKNEDVSRIVSVLTNTLNFSVS